MTLAAGSHLGPSTSALTNIVVVLNWAEGLKRPLALAYRLRALWMVARASLLRDLSNEASLQTDD